MSEPQLLIVGPKRGRPRLEEPQSHITARIPVKLHDQLIRLAKQRDVSVSAIVRALIDRRISLHEK